MIPIGDTPNPVKTPYVTWALIALNILVYVVVAIPRQRPLDQDELARPEVQQALEGIAENSGAHSDMEFQVFLSRVEAYDLVVWEHGYKPGAASWWDLLACMFLHGGLAHLLGNMLYLWIYGDNVEARLGPVWYLLSYLVTGVVATWSFSVMAGGSMVPLVGASGAISGVLGFYLVWYPRNRVKMLIWYYIITVMYLPAAVVLILYVVIQNAFPMLMGAESSTAYGAHLGGFFAGMLLAYLLKDTLPKPEMQPERVVRGRLRRNAW